MSPNLATRHSGAGGFVPKSKTKEWTPPTLRRFESPEEVWAYYKDKGTAEERANLLKLLHQWPTSKGEDRRIKRRV